MVPAFLAWFWELRESVRTVLKLTLGVHCVITMYLYSLFLENVVKSYLSVSLKTRCTLASKQHEPRIN